MDHGRRRFTTAPMAPSPAQPSSAHGVWGLKVLGESTPNPPELVQSLSAIPGKNHASGGKSPAFGRFNPQFLILLRLNGFRMAIPGETGMPCNDFRPPGEWANFAGTAYSRWYASLCGNEADDKAGRQSSAHRAGRPGGRHLAPAVAGPAGVAGVVAALGSGSGPSRAGTLSPCCPHWVCACWG